jgi:hypothetical protein
VVVVVGRGVWRTNSAKLVEAAAAGAEGGGAPEVRRNAAVEAEEGAAVDDDGRTPCCRIEDIFLLNGSKSVFCEGCREVLLLLVVEARIALIHNGDSTRER